MNFGGMGFVVAIVALSMLAWVITTAIQAKHGYPLTDEWGNTIHPKGADDTARALAAENAELKANIERLEDRLKVLERIATDPSRRLADDIDNLR